MGIRHTRATLWCNIGEKAQLVRLFNLRSETQQTKDTGGGVAFEKLIAIKNAWYFQEREITGQ